MKMNLPLYAISGLMGLLSIYAGLTGTKLPFIKDTRSAVIALGAAGFLMCSFGAIGAFVSKTPAHPMTVSGYILGTLALLTVIVQIFKLKVPFLSDSQTALTFLIVIIIIKVVIARFGFLLDRAQ